MSEYCSFALLCCMSMSLQEQVLFCVTCLTLCKSIWLYIMQWTQLRLETEEIRNILLHFQHRVEMVERWKSWHWECEEQLTPLNSKLRWEAVCPVSVSHSISCSPSHTPFSNAHSWSPVNSSSSKIHLTMPRQADGVKQNFGTCVSLIFPIFFFFSPWERIFAANSSQASLMCLCKGERKKE